MNSLQLNTVLPNQTQSVNQIQTQKNDGSSFAEILKAAQKNDDEKSLEISQNQNQNSSQSEKIESENQKADENLSDEKSSKIAQKDDSSKTQDADKNEKSSKSDKKLAKKSDSEKDEKNLKNENHENLIPGNADLVSSKIARNEKILQKTEKVSDVKSTLASQKSQKTDKIDEKSLAWLKSEKIDGKNQAENEDDFAELIDAALDFIPGSETEAEKLENAQNFAISDPESFLAQVHELADAEIEGKNQLKSDEKVSDKKSKKGKVTFDVHDLRTAKAQNTENAKSIQKVAAKKEITGEITQKNDAQNQITMEFAGKVNENITSSSNQAAGASGSTFQAMLSSSVQENAGEIVKAGNIILKDNNSGSINLILKPEALGNVKISLNLNDKVISGQINVQSQEAFEAFKENLESLKQAFAQSGFETGNFDLNFSQQSFAQGGNSSNGENQAASFFAEKAYGDFVSLGNESKSDGAFVDASGRNYSVNIVA